MNQAFSCWALFPRRLWLTASAVLIFGVALLVGYFALRHAWAWQQFGLAQDALARQDFDKATDHLVQNLIVWPDSPGTLLLAARTARRADRLDEAQRLLDQYRAKVGNTQELIQERRLLDAQKGQLGELGLFLRTQLTAGHPDKVLILEALAKGCHKQHRPGDVHHYADALVQAQPDHVQGLLLRGWAREKLRRSEEALDDYRKVVATQPDNEWARVSLGEVLLNLKRYPEAVEQFTWLRQRHPDNGGVGLGLARSLRGMGEVDRARDLLNELAAAFPAEGLILSERGQLALEEQQLELAERFLRSAEVLMPWDRQVHFSLAQCYRRQGRSEEADEQDRLTERLGEDEKKLSVLEEELVKTPTDAAKHCEASVLCLRAGKPDEAERHLLAVLSENPNHEEALQALANIYKKIGKKPLPLRLQAPEMP